jgi:hypothetical protein
MTSQWESLGGRFDTAVAVVSRISSPDQLDLFSRGTDSTLQHKSWNGTWSAWETIGVGGVIMSEPNVVSWGSNRLDIFAVGTDGATWHMVWNSTTWRGWESLGGVTRAPPTAVSWAANRIDPSLLEWIVHVGIGGGMVRLETNGKVSAGLLYRNQPLWHGVLGVSMFCTCWTAPFGTTGGTALDARVFGNQLAVSSHQGSSGPNRLDVFGTGKDHTVWHQR